METVRVKHQIRNRVPKKDIRGRIGKVVHKLDDGYWLLEFENIIVRKGIQVGNKTFYKPKKPLL